MPDSAPTPDNVAAFYDEFTELMQDLLGGRAIHTGYRLGDAARADEGAAQDRLTLAVADRLHVAPGSRVLDIGCGTGQPAILIAETTGAAVTGINISERQIAAAQARDPGTARVEFQLADAMDLPFPDASFDAAYMIESLMHMPDYVRALGQARRCLRPGGTLVIADFVAPAPLDTPRKRSGIPLHVAQTRHQLAAFLKDSGLEMVRAEDIHSEVAPSLQGVLAYLDADHPSHRDRLGDRYDEVVAMLRAGVETGLRLVYTLITARHSSA